MLIIKVIDLPDNKAALLSCSVCSEVALSSRDCKYLRYLQCTFKYVNGSVGRRSPHLTLNRISSQHPQPQLAPATHLAFLITQAPITARTKLSFPDPLDTYLTAYAAPKEISHPVYFLIKISRIC